MPVFNEEEAYDLLNKVSIECSESEKRLYTDFDKFTTITDYIYEQFDLTFGNRILNQINQIVPVYVACGGKKEEAIDFLLSRKVISKLEGRFEEYVKGALRELLNLIHKTYGPNVLVRSEKEIQSLMRKL